MAVPDPGAFPRDGSAAMIVTAQLRRYRLRQGICVLLALVLLNGSVTFHNIWPTLGIHWPGELSVEFGVLLLVLAVSNAWLGTTRSPVLALLSAVTVLFALGRYAYVTVQALYGRDINLYWDGPQFAAVTGMFVRVASPWVVSAVAVGTALVLGVLYVVARWSLGQIDAVLRMYRRGPMGPGGPGSRAVRLLFRTAGERCGAADTTLLNPGDPDLRRADRPGLRGAQRSCESRCAAVAAPAFQLCGACGQRCTAGVHGVLWQPRPLTGHSSSAHFCRRGSGCRRRMQDTGRGVVSAFVTSPTFGGGSVLAHLSLLSGIEVRDPDHYVLLMTQQRPTLVSLFKSAGYRAVAVMPGLRESWPEGAFYGFDEIYGAPGLDYQGPAFGWWRIPDQFSLAALDARELQPHPRKPVFVFFPTVSTHMPFEPTPPLQPDWQRVLTAKPFDAEPLARALTRTPVWTDMGQAYLSSGEYFLDTLSSYLRARPNGKFVLIILGDHQPAANVSGEGASWDVPVHVIASQPQILTALRRMVFGRGWCR